MVYGQSVTDACIHWEDTVELLRGLAGSVAQRQARLAKSA
jgi:3-deoxy-7-phosphoheptulonate synthase